MLFNINQLSLIDLNNHDTFIFIFHEIDIQFLVKLIIYVSLLIVIISIYSFIVNEYKLFKHTEKLF